MAKKESVEVILPGGHFQPFAPVQIPLFSRVIKSYLQHPRILSPLVSSSQFTFEHSSQFESQEPGHLHQYTIESHDNSKAM